jgi:Holliday junction resolvasome RuvABC endonuclease subunit
MRSLGLDPSLLSYGWTIYDDEAEGLGKIVSSGHPKTLSTTVPVARYVHFRQTILDLLSRFKVDVVGLESPAYGGGEFSERHFGLMMFSSEAVFEKRKDFVLYDPSTVKYLATGSNRAQKSDMIRHAQLELKTTRSLQADEVDAYHVAKFALRFYQLKLGLLAPEDLTDPEKRVFLLRTKRRKTKFGIRTKRTAQIFRENNRYFMFSKVPEKITSLPEKDEVDPSLLSWIESF